MRGGQYSCKLSHAQLSYACSIQHARKYIYNIYKCTQGGILNLFLGMTMYCVPIMGLIGFGGLVITGVVLLLLYDYLSWAKEWGDWLMYSRPKDMQKSSGAPRLILEIIFAVALLLCVIMALVFCVAIFKTNPLISKPYYDKCVVGRVHTTSAWWIYFALGCGLLAFVAIFNFVMYKMNTRSADGDSAEDYTLMM